MFRTARIAFYYGAFAAASLAVHAALLWPKQQTDRQEIADLARQIHLNLAELEQMIPEPPPLPPPPPPPSPSPEPPKPPEDPKPEKYKETPKPEDKKPEPEPAPPPSPSPEPPPQPPKEEPRPAPPPEERKPEPKPEPAPARVEEPAASRAEEPSPRPEPKPELASLKDYRRFLAREMKTEGADTAYVPKIRFGDNTADDNRQIMRYFGMELIAYPKSQKFYVYIDPDQNLYSRSNEFDYIRNFSNRVIFRSSPYFDGLRREAARRVGADPDSLVVAQLLKPASAAYIAWKEGESAKRAGVAIDDVDSCDASFARTPFGAWIVKIDALALRDGRRVAVSDFEWEKVSATNGGGR